VREKSLVKTCHQKTTGEGQENCRVWAAVYRMITKISMSSEFNGVRSGIVIRVCGTRNKTKGRVRVYSFLRWFWTCGTLDVSQRKV